MPSRVFALLPGGGMSSWIWRDLEPLLGLPVVAPAYRLPRNDLESRTKSTIADCARHLESLLDQAGAERAIVVAHSGAGLIGAAFAKAYPERVERVVYLSANIPRSGQSAVGALPFLLRKVNETAIKSMARRDSTPMAKMEKTIRSRFCNACDDETVRYVLGHELLSEPVSAAMEKVDWSGFPPVPQTYVVLAQDKTLSPERLRAMAANLGIADIRELPGDHMAMLSRPRELADLLNALGSKST
jgi:pimeloyl-ACP methyl ester carboxylesterase